MSSQVDAQPMQATPVHDQILPAIRAARQLAIRLYSEQGRYARLLESLNDVYDKIREHFHKRQMSDQSIIDGGVLAEYTVGCAWNKHRLGVVTPKWHDLRRIEAILRQARPSDANLLITHSDSFDTITYNPFDDIPNDLEAYPVWTTLLQRGFNVQDPRSGPAADVLSAVVTADQPIANSSSDVWQPVEQQLAQVCHPQEDHYGRPQNNATNCDFVQQHQQLGHEGRSEHPPTPPAHLPVWDGDQNALITDGLSSSQLPVYSPSTPSSQDTHLVVAADLAEPTSPNTPLSMSSILNGHWPSAA